jgi:outer membrane protein OmpA-like peptidoglycan-associated protein
MLNKGFLLILFFVFFIAEFSVAQKKLTNNFFFATDVSELDSRQKEAFLQFANEIDTVGIISISIFGYCDDIGRKGYNDTLSNKRAQHIKSLLTAKGIEEGKITVIIGKGKLDLTTAKNIEEQRSFNRRAELVINYTKKKLLNEKELLSDTLKVGDKIILDNILFENSRSLLLEESIPVLERLTKIIKEKPQYNIAILGHICCNPPGRDVKDFETGEYNLSQARAKVIYDYLVYKGIDSKRLTYKGMMANYPLGKGEKNDRRVELQITSINFANK